MRIGIVGATGKVGRMMLACLEESDIKYDELVLFASAKSAGSTVEHNGREYVIQETNSGSFARGFDYLLFSAGGSVSKEYAPYAIDVGATVIDNSSAFRRDDNIPLVIPEINGHLLNSYKGIIANPNCSTIQLLLVLKPLNDYVKIKKVVVTTLQSVSGSGYNGINELHNQRKGIFEKGIYPRQIDLNVIPQIGDMEENQYSQEENKMTYETKKILNDKDFNLVATTVRVPVVYGHSESVYIEFENRVDIKDIKELLSKNEAIDLQDKYITPLEIGDSDLSHVSRIRYAGDDKSIFLWNVAHNVRLGAATNAVKILKLAAMNKY